MNDNQLVSQFMSLFFADGVMASRVRSDVATALSDYFSIEHKGFTGSQFESLLADSSEDLVGAKDLVSITTLSVSIPPRGAIWLLSEEGQSEVTALLKLIPPDVDIWEPAARSLFETHSTLHQLWDLIGEANWPRRRKGGGFGGVTKRSKLLAAKRPRLIPVVDGVIRNALSLSPDPWQAFAQYGRCLHQLLASQDLREKFKRALVHVDVPSGVPLLRRIDIVIWKNNVKQK